MQAIRKMLETGKCLKNDFSCFSSDRIFHERLMKSMRKANGRPSIKPMKRVETRKY